MCFCMQVTGAQFLFRLWAQGHGGILADDMGKRPSAALSAVQVCIVCVVAALGLQTTRFCPMIRVGYPNQGRVGYPLAAFLLRLATTCALSGSVY